MNDWPTLSKAEIYQWVSDESFGLDDKQIHHPSCTAHTLQGLHQGPMREFYRIKMTIGSSGIEGGHCSCPVGYGGRCAHAAALLFLWLEQPELFLKVEPLISALDRHNEAELKKRLHQMMVRYPDLETLFDLPLPGTGTELKTELVKRQVQLAMSGYDRSKWRTAATVAKQLEHLLALATEYTQSNECHNALVIYEVMVHQVLAEYDSFQDEEGDFHGIINECVEGLAICLRGTLAWRAYDASYKTSRLRLLRTLFDVYYWDIKAGGIEMGYEAPAIILAQSNASEKEQIVAWIEQVITVSQEEWVHHVLRRFKLALQEEGLHDEEFIRICYEQGFYEALVNRLLRLERIKEAKKLLRQVPDHELLPLIELFVHYDHTDLAEQLLRERVSHSENNALLLWLKHHNEKKGDDLTTLQIVKQLFLRLRTFSSYQEVKLAAKKVGQWESLQVQLIEELTDSEEFALLTEIYLSENDIDQALLYLSKIGGGFQWGGADLSIEVARTIEMIRPRAAINLYLSKINSLIKRRGRENYALAASYLKRIRKLYIDLNEINRWNILIKYLRQQHRHTVALIDELEKGRL